MLLVVVTVLVHHSNQQHMVPVVVPAQVNRPMNHLPSEVVLLVDLLLVQAATNHHHSPAVDMVPMLASLLVEPSVWVELPV